MKPLIIGFIILIAALVYHIMFNKEGFEDAANMSSDVMDAIIHTMKNMPKDKLEKYGNELKAIEDIEDSKKQLYMSLNKLQELREYYTYPKFSFDVFMLKYLDETIVKNTEEVSDEDMKMALSEIGRLKMIANVTDEMPSEKMLKAKLEASAAKDAEKKAKLEKKRLEKEKTLAVESASEATAALSASAPLPSPSIQQGAQFNNHRCEPPCPNVCESDDYIRKDSIPCWNCNLPRSN